MKANEFDVRARYISGDIFIPFMRLESHHGGDVGPSRFPFDDEAVHVSSDEEVHV